MTNRAASLGSNCKICQQPITDAKRRPDGSIHARCRPCINAKRRQDRADKLMMYRDASRQRHRRRRETAIKALGSACACCGERNPLFIELDRADGSSSRKGTSRLVTGIIRGDTKSAKLICANCKTGRNRNGGVCPHQVRADKRNDGKTHWYGCYTAKGHHECALDYILRTRPIGTAVHDAAQYFRRTQ